VSYTAEGIPLARAFDKAVGQIGAARGIGLEFAKIDDRLPPAGIVTSALVVLMGFRFLYNIWTARSHDGQEYLRDLMSAGFESATSLILVTALLGVSHLALRLFYKNPTRGERRHSRIFLGNYFLAALLMAGSIWLNQAALATQVYPDGTWLLPSVAATIAVRVNLAAMVVWGSMMALGACLGFRHLSLRIKSVLVALFPVLALFGILGRDAFSDLPNLFVFGVPIQLFLTGLGLLAAVIIVAAALPAGCLKPYWRKRAL
jgi:hypothetical protein